MNGILVVNKPAGYTSHDIVAKIRKELNIKKVGHTGTLDPLATGVLPILIGNGTKLSKYLINHDKEYIATIKLGEKTDTGDIEGKVTETKPIEEYSQETILQVLKSFEGVQKQIPPIYSAIKINGKKLYEYAREGKAVQAPSRTIEIYRIELLNYNLQTIKIKVKCSKGTYIRSLCQDIAQKLGTLGTMQDLQRTQVGEFKIENSIELQGIGKEKIKSIIITAEQLFINNPKISLPQNQLIHFLNGVKLVQDNPNGIYRIYDKTNRFIGIGIIENNRLKREYVNE